MCVCDEKEEWDRISATGCNRTVFGSKPSISYVLFASRTQTSSSSRVGNDDASRSSETPAAPAVAAAGGGEAQPHQPILVKSEVDSEE